LERGKKAASSGAQHQRERKRTNDCLSVVRDGTGDESARKRVGSAANALPRKPKKSEQTKSALTDSFFVFFL
jgi:hypothetical protein